MNVGWIGLGKLGLPAALTLATYGRNRVVAYDTADRPWQVLAGEAPRPLEVGIDDLIGWGELHRAADVREVVLESDVVFIAVPTPHEARFGGDRPLPLDERLDFSYDAVVAAVADVARAADQTGRRPTVVVISTTLPGAFRRFIVPAAGGLPLVYQPYFISLGTVSRDVRSPELILLGVESNVDMALVYDVYAPLFVDGWPPVHVCDYTTAELAKMAYNVSQSLKITFVNHLTALADGLGADVRRVLTLLGSDYRPGLPDGGPCRPRDLIALAHLERRLGVPPFFDELAVRRQEHARWLARRSYDLARERELPLVALGRTYKPGVDLVDGSPGVLVLHYLRELDPNVVSYDPVLDEGCIPVDGPALFLILTVHDEFLAQAFPIGSVVVDPWYAVHDQAGVDVVRLGGRR